MPWFFIQIVRMQWFLCRLFFYVYVWGTCKNVLVLRVCFLTSKIIQAKNVKKHARTVYLQLLFTVSG